MKVTSIKDLLIVKDNFFEEKVYNQILYDISRLKFESRYSTCNEKNKNIARIFTAENTFGCCLCS